VNSKLASLTDASISDSRVQKTQTQIENERLLKQQQENLAKSIQMEEKRKKVLLALFFETPSKFQTLSRNLTAHS
jgi:hypothetical protein